MSTNVREETDKFIFSILKNDSNLIKEVTRRFVGLDFETGAIQGISRHEMPAVIVNSGNQDANTGGPAGSRSFLYRPEIVGYVHDKDEYFTELNELITEVTKILFLNRAVAYNGQCIATLEDINAIRVDRGRLAPLAAFTMEPVYRFSIDPKTGGELT